MAAKAKSNPLNGMHTAGIFSDMTIDGPDIGTLVLIVDRAKNLPNRKTIGKQDPYVAARLGKEAKKTTTDVRGGQTPRWDQELRFNVHDSPDYYQLKLSVFNDDKKTDLIGETWIDLRDIIMPGGGQSDQWHSLNCKGKYAGEIRIETTYYDSRPKPDKPASKPRPAAAPVVEQAEHSVAGPAGGTPRTIVKRRPLPSDPTPRKQPDRIESGPRPQPSLPGASIPKQSPLQAIEYAVNEPQPRHDVAEDDFYGHGFGSDPRGMSGHGQPAYDSAPPSIRSSRHSFDAIEQPPPPPAHRNRGGSMPSQEMVVHRGGFDVSPHKATQPMMRHDVLRNEAHRHSIGALPSSSSSSSSYPGRPTYRPYDSAPEVPGGNQYQDYEYQHHQHHPSTPRHHSYDPAYDAQSRSLQPTVEDVPESWTPPKPRYSQSQEMRTPPNAPPTHQRTSPYDSPYESDRDIQTRASPAPLNISGRSSATSSRYQNSPSPLSDEPSAYDGPDYCTMSNAVVPRGYYHATPSPSPARGHSQDSYVSQGNELELRNRRRSVDFSGAAVPATLVPGFDPSMQEITERIYDDRRRERRYTQPAPMSYNQPAQISYNQPAQMNYNQPTQMVTPTRGREPGEPPVQYTHHSSPHGRPQGSNQVYGRSPPAYGGDATSPMTAARPPSMHRGVSPAPNPNHTIRRKSVSPAPLPSEAPGDGRRLSGVPFGPDDYDELNPAVVSAKDAATPARHYTNAYGNIVTADGREIDPSDHLPEDTWAPEPEPKKPLNKAEEPRSRPALSGPHPMPKNIRVTVRPNSMAIPPSHSAPSLAIVDREPPAPLHHPVSTGRNRLQKKQHRASALPAPINNGSSPLGPASSHQRNCTPPRAMVRASTFDYENQMVPYDRSAGAARSGYGNAPPIPAKITMMSGGMGPAGYGGGAPGGDWALMQEMSRIDLGSGRARRHGGH